jgi:perosamine synthetase
MHRDLNGNTDLRMPLSFQQVEPRLPVTIAMAAPELDTSDINAVLNVLRSGRLALGPYLSEFEHRMAAYIGVRHAVAVNSGTAALHLLVRSLGLGPGDEVLVPSFTFASSVNAILFEGATPVFVDIDPKTYNLDPQDLAAKVTPRTRAILAVDVFGHPAPWTEITALAEKHGLRVIDDCCEAIGAEYRGRKIGTFGDAGTFAFYPNKQMTTGEGGMIVTNDGELARLTRSLANQGRAMMGSWLEHEHLGYNYRLDEMSAALGCSQLQRIDLFLRKRERVAAMYTAHLADLPEVRPQVVQSHVRMSWFVYVVTLPPGLQRDTVIDALDQLGVPSRAYFAPIHLQPYIARTMGDLRGTLPVTEAMASRTLALPFHNNLTEQEVACVVHSLQKCVSNLSALAR